MQIFRSALVPLLFFGLNPLNGQTTSAKAPPAKMANAPKMHAVALGAARRVPYTPPDIDAADKSEDTTTLKVRPLLVDDLQREWTMGEIHEVTDRSFAVRRVMRLNDALATDREAHWVWQ